MNLKEFARRVLKLRGVTIEPPYVVLRTVAVTFKLRPARPPETWTLELWERGIGHRRFGSRPWLSKRGEMVITPMEWEFVVEDEAGLRRWVPELKHEVANWEREVENAA